MRPLAASPPGAPFKISAGPFGTQLESKVRCSKTSSRSPPRLDKRFRLLVEHWGPRPGVANRAPNGLAVGRLDRVLDLHTPCRLQVLDLQRNRLTVRR